MRLSYLEGKAESLVMDLSTVSNEKEVVVQKLQDATLKCNQQVHASKELLGKLEQEFLDCKEVAQEITWLTGPPLSSSSLFDWVTSLIGAFEEEHQMVERASEEIEALTKTTEEKAFELQKCEGKVESLSAELSKEQQEKEAVVDELRKAEVDLERTKDELESLAEKNVVLESEMKSVRTMLQVQNALMGFEDIVEYIRLFKSRNGGKHD